jgi:hypothetical protein
MRRKSRNTSESVHVLVIFLEFREHPLHASLNRGEISLAKISVLNLEHLDIFTYINKLSVYLKKKLDNFRIL